MSWIRLLIDSGVWLLKAYAVSIVLFCLAVWALTRFTAWGRQFWDVSGAYFSPRGNWKSLAGVAIILLLTLSAVRLDVMFSSWYNDMYTALQRSNEVDFWFAIWLFGILAMVDVVRSLIEFYVQQAFTIHWRVWLNEKLLSQWLERQAYFRTQYLVAPIENPDQRIQQDINSFVTNSLSLCTGAINALVAISAFTPILWHLSGPLSLFGATIPRAMVFLIFAYVIVATVLAIRIGHPLISLNFLTERINADYRYALVRLREYAESVAFYSGESAEGALLRDRFAQIIANSWAVVYRTLKLLGFNLTVTQIAGVFAFVIQAPRFFTKRISLGDLIQTGYALGRVQHNLSFIRNAYDSFAAYRATLDRLTGFTSAIAFAHALPTPDERTDNERVVLDKLTVYQPDHQLLLKSVSLEVEQGAPLLVRGASGSGKTTLLRTIAGLWPYSEGIVIRPKNNVIFLSQKPYLPLGSLRDALYYPNQVLHGDMNARASESDLNDDPTRAGFTHAALVHQSEALPQAIVELLPAEDLPPVEAGGQAIEVLRRIQLGHLTEHLDEVADWRHILSPGEQQRLAFGRLILAKPQVAFLDEATSAMDEGMEDTIYRLVRQLLPDTILISVGHRSTLVRHHKRQLILQGGGRWILQ